MSTALKKKFTTLSNTIHSDTCNHPNRTNLIQALKEAALLAGAEEKGTDYHLYLEELHTRLENVINGNALEIDNHVLHLVDFVKRNHTSDSNKLAPNKWRAVLILVVAALEFLVLTLALGALLALAGAGIFGAGFLLAGMCFTVDPTILQIVALAGAFLGAVCGIVGGIIGAAKLTDFTVQAMKTSDWAGFEAHDSLWDLVVNGATKKMRLDDKIKDNIAFFSQDKQQENRPDEKIKITGFNI